MHPFSASLSVHVIHITPLCVWMCACASAVTVYPNCRSIFGYIINIVVVVNNSSWNVAHSLIYTVYIFAQFMGRVTWGIQCGVKTTVRRISFSKNARKALEYRLNIASFWVEKPTGSVALNCSSYLVSHWTWSKCCFNKKKIDLYITKSVCLFNSTNDLFTVSLKCVDFPVYELYKHITDMKTV